MVSVKSLKVFTLLFWICVDKGNQHVPKLCEGKFTEGSLSKPCGLCNLCRKKWDRVKHVTVDKCSGYLEKWADFMTDNYKKWPLVSFATSERKFCSTRKFCSKFGKCGCENGRKDEDNKSVCINLFGTCKCGCNETRYGQECEYVIPPGLSSDSFADVVSLVYGPFLYSTDFATITVYFQATGVNLIAEVKTQRELLTYNSTSCKTNVVPRDELCSRVYGDAGLEYYQSTCDGGSTYEQHPKISCAMTINLAFPRTLLHSWLEKQFLMSYDEEMDFPNRTIVAKFEKLTLRVYNNITTLSENVTIFFTNITFIVIYVGKSPLEDCPPIITIYKFGRTVYKLPHFPRRKEISVATAVLLKKGISCENLGDPILNWFVWIMEVNHDEKYDPPFYEKLQTSVLELRPFSLDYGLYKVKGEVRFVMRHFNVETTYCYFKIIQLPLQPIIIGGSLRYIYYKNDLEFTITRIIDPNSPSDQQPGMIHIWTCNDTEYFCEKFTTDHLSLTIRSPFLPGKAYNFTMFVVTTTALKEFTNQVIVMSQHPIPSLLIECLRNCGGKHFQSNVREIFYFKVSHSKHSAGRENGSIYNWTYSIGDNSYINVEKVRQHETTPDWVLIVKEDSLISNRVYSFKVRGGGEPQGEAVITVTTFSLFEILKCDINPNTGISGKTKFYVECYVVNNDTITLSMTYTVYDKFSRDELEGGRLLGSSFVETIRDIILTRGTVAVYATNLHGQYKRAFVTVTLSSPNITSGFLEESFNEFQNLSRGQGYEQKISFISAVCDILNNNPSMKRDAGDVFLESISKEKATDMIQIELLLSTTQSVICQGDNCSMPSISGRGYTFLCQILSKVSRKFTSEVIRTAHLRTDITTLKINKLYIALLKCAGVLLAVRDDRLANKTYEYIDFRLYELYKFGNLEMLRLLDRVNVALAIRNLPYIEYRNVQTEHIETWMKEDVPTFFTIGTKGNYGGSYVKISPQLANFLNRVTHHVVLQTMEFKDNPFWWSPGSDVTTEVISISLGYKIGYKSYTPIESFLYPVDIFLKKNDNENITVAGEVTQPDSAADPVARDLAVSVHKLYPHTKAKMSLKFLDLGENDVFRVRLLVNQRPDYDLLIHGKEVTKSSPWYYPSKKTSDDDDILFIGILPGPNISTGKTVHYTFQLQSALCQAWHEGLWSTSSCNLGSGSTEKYLHCQCYRLSSIAGFLGVPINMVDPFTDYKLFLSIPDNPFVFAIITTLLLLFFLLLIWSVKTDKEDMQKTSLIVLEDNISSDEFGYLVIVFTGQRLCAGTTSNIGMILHGSDASSRSHILRSSTRPTLKRDSDDWFLIFAPIYLGTISSIQFWTDHSGPNPNWYCDKVHVHDLSSKKVYTFVLEKWFGVTQLRTRVEAFARPIKLGKEVYFVEFFLTNTIFGFRESHLWISILSRHPRSLISRSQRLSMAMVALLTTLLTSIMFYRAVMPEGEDAPQYSVNTQAFLISIYSAVISTSITAVVFVAFRKSYIYYEHKVASSKRRDTAMLQEEARMNVDSVQSLKVSKQSERNVKYYLKKLILSIRKENFYPIQAGTDSNTRKHFVVVHKVRAIFAWLLCICVIVTTSFFIILYGLKIGKVKSLLWLTSTGMSLGEDIFLIDPVKIISISLLFGMVQTQLCDVYVYDPTIYEMRKKSKIKRDLIRDHFIHEMRLLPFYKPVSTKRVEMMNRQLMKIQSWWAFIDVVDICLAVIAVFFLISQAVFGEYPIDLLFTQMLFKNVKTGENYIPTPTVSNISSYTEYLQSTIFPAIYKTHWYNEQPLTVESEAFAESGWTQDCTRRMMGVPRLRQIRVKRQYCNIPVILKKLSFYCNALFSLTTEDTDDYGAHWRNLSSDDVIIHKSPWRYVDSEDSSSITMFAASNELFHGGGYVAELKRSRRKSADTVLNLVDADWFDIRTHIIFFEMSTYSVNDNFFSSIVFITENLESTLVLSGKRIWSIIIRPEYAVIETIYFLFTTLALIKLIMLLNTVGARVFFSSFWSLYDLCLIIIGTFCFVGYRIFSQIASIYINDFHNSGKDNFFQFQALIFYMHLERNILGLLMILTTIRSLRLLKYGTWIISKKERDTLYLSWPKIMCVSLIFITFMFILQRLVGYLVNCLYHLEISHLIFYKKSHLTFGDIVLSTQQKIFLFLPCIISYLAMFLYKMILIKSYTAAVTIFKTDQMKEDFKFNYE